MAHDGIEVAMPTHESGTVLEGTLDALARSSDHSAVPIERLVIVDDESEDATQEIAADCADRHDWGLEVVSRPTALPEAREIAIDEVETEWFLFLDDDVRVSEPYLGQLCESRSPAIGAVQGRKRSREEQNTDWVRRRARRGGTHATLCRREAVEDVTFPEDLTVLEDEYLRRYVEDAGYLWIFNHQARFEHESQDRHPIGWQEGFLAGKYGLKAFHECALNVPFAAVDGRNPLPHVERTAGWITGRLDRSFTLPTRTPETTHDR